MGASLVAARACVLLPRSSAKALFAAAGLACAMLVGLPGPASAQLAAPTSIEAPQEWSKAWGMAAAPGEATLQAERVRVWRDESRGATQVVLEGDVRVTLATTTLAARRAVAWIRAESGPNGAPQVAIFLLLDDVGDAADASGQHAGGITVAADRLPVRAVLAIAEATVRAGVREEGEPTRGDRERIGELLEAGETALVRSLALHEGARRAFTFTPATIESDPQAPEAAPRRFRASLDDAPAPTKRARQEASASPRAEPGKAQPQNRTPATPSQPNPPARAAESSPAQAPSQPVVPATTSIQSNPPATSTQPVLQAPAQSPPQNTPSPSSALFAKSGTLTFSAGHVAVLSSGPEPAVILSDGLTFLYNDATTGRLLQARAQRAVLFLAANAQQDAGLRSEFAADEVSGVFLEGDVRITDGDLNLRAREVYYDLAANRAIMLDATFHFVEPTRGLPLYIRAKEIRQESQRQFQAKQVRFSNTAFFEPELGIGVSTATLERREREVELDEDATPDEIERAKRQAAYTYVTAENVTLRVNDVPFFWWPTYSGDPASPLIRDIRFENRTGSGGAARVRWNATNLLGLSRFDGLSVDLQTDYYLERGAAIGTKAAWETKRHVGGLTAYALPSDDGTDVLKSGEERDANGDFRGVITLEDRFRVDGLWSVMTQGAYISDATFIDAFFEEAGQSRREFTNRLRAERTDRNTQFTAEAKGTFNDFLANEWLLQSQGYSVTKLPEVAYVRQADDLLPAVPGLLTWFSEYRAGSLQLAFDEIAMDQRGFSSVFLADRVFGIAPNESPADALRASGLTEDPVTRLDTRHELVATLQAGPVRYAPFAVVRGTAYDDDFEDFSSTPGGNDNMRVWSSVGMRASTTIERIHDGVDSRFLDIHRLRHIVEPNLTLWAAGTNVEADDLPAFDPNVDTLADGAAVRLGLSQTVLTKRGEPGRWYDARLLSLNTDVVFASEDSEGDTPIGRFFDARPERSALGDFFAGDFAYRLTDATTLTASLVYDFETHQQDVATYGVLFQHEPGFSTLVDLRYLNAQDSTIVTIVGSYELSDKYSILISPNYNATEGEVQSVGARISRKFSAFLASVGVSFNNISGEASFSFVLQPYGARGSLGVEGLGTDLPGAYGAGGGGGL